MKWIMILKICQLPCLSPHSYKDERSIRICRHSPVAPCHDDPFREARAASGSCWGQDKITVSLGGRSDALRLSTLWKTWKNSCNVLCASPCPSAIYITAIKATCIWHVKIVITNYRHRASVLHAGINFQPHQKGVEWQSRYLTILYIFTKFYKNIKYKRQKYHV